MTWVKLDDQFADNPKLERAGPLAAWLSVAALCYSARHLTDGFIPQSKAARLADIPTPGKHVKALIREGVWHEPGHTCESPLCGAVPDGHYLIHDYLDYQRSRADVEAEREKEREKKRAQREKGSSTRNGDGTFAGSPNGTTPGHPEGSPRGTTAGTPAGTPVGNHQGSPSVPDPTRPYPSRDNDARGRQSPALALVPVPASAPPAPCRTTPTGGGYPSDFEAWWQLYPVKKGKHDAGQAWRRARGQATWDQLIGGLRASVAAWQAEGRESRFIPRAATWLSGRRWEDDHTAPPPGRTEPRAFDSIRAGLERRGSA